MDSDGARSAGGRPEVTGDRHGERSTTAAAREDALIGVVTEQLPSALYRVRLEAGQLVTAHIADRMDRNFIRLLVGDRVAVELSPVDRGRGRITAKVTG
jgi:translation initiation factor IF-1